MCGHGGKVSVAALGFRNNWYSTQFHPETRAETLGTIWRKTFPHYCNRYNNNDVGDLLIEIFLKIVIENSEVNGTNRSTSLSMNG